MVTTTAEVKKWGNSFGILIKSEVSKKLGLKNGEKVSVDIVPKKRFSAFGILKTKKSFERDHDDREFK